ncbi:winged helix DNA-binding domain-containing protein, partial [Mycolicibacterium vaccae]|nr:winged helix DNA-binding domain-containing protein [Mycolicibacterium vaccae]
DDEEAVRELTFRAATALGVGTAADIRDYFRLAPAQVKPALAKLVADGELECVDVGGWSAPAYLYAGQTIPAARPRHGAVVPVRPVDLLSATGAAVVRFSLPHRDLHPRGQAAVRLLRVAVSA